MSALRGRPPVRVEYPNVKFDGDSWLVEGTRVPVRRLFGWHRQGTSVEHLLRRYPQLGPARIFSALAFAYDNLELITWELLAEREVLARQTPREASDTLNKQADGVLDSLLKDK